MANITQQQYISNWHDSFVNYVNHVIGTIVSAELSPMMSEEDKRGLGLIKVLFEGNDVRDVERDLANGIVRQSTLDKIEKLGKDFSDICVDHIEASYFMKQVLKQLCHIKVEIDKTAEVMRLNALGVAVTK